MSAAPESTLEPLFGDEIACALCAFALLVPFTIAGANLAWGAVLVALLFAARKGRKLDFAAARGALKIPLWLYVAAALASVAFGVAPLHSLRYLHQDVHKLWLYYLLSIALASTAAKPPLEACLAAGFSLAGLVGIAQSLHALATGNLAGFARAHAFVHPVTFGEQACLFALGAVCFLLDPPASAASPRARRAAACFFALCMAALLLSNTRAAMVALASGLAALIPFLDRRLRGRICLGTAAIGVLLLGMDLAFKDRSLLGQSLGWWPSNNPAGAQFMRLTLWKAAWRMGLDHPIFGVGINNYRQQFPAYFQIALEGGARTWGTAHNLYLHHFAERGVAGLAALAGLGVAMTARAWRRARRRPRAWNLWALAALAAFWTMNLTEVALQTEILWMLVFFIWLRAEALERRAETA